MSPLLFLGLSAAGGLGATARMHLDGVIRGRVAHPLPVGTIAINVLGSLLLGLALGFAARSVLPAEWVAVLGTGLLGGFTTFSTASFETVQLMRDGRWRLGLVNGLGTLLATAAAAGFGLWLSGGL